MISDKQLFDCMKQAAQEIYQGATALPYHNWDHANHCVVTHDRLYGPPSESSLNQLAQKLALYFHDAVYVPGAGGDNEKLSAKLFIWHLRRLVSYDEYDAFWVEFHDNRRGSLEADSPANLLEACMYVPTWINCTLMAHHMSHAQFGPSLDAVLDCDLASLARPLPAFQAQQLAIITEQEPGEKTETKMNELLARQARFLENFLQKPHIYRTREARSVLEEQARANIVEFRKYVDTLFTS